MLSLPNTSEGMRNPLESASMYEMRGHAPTTVNTDTDAGKGVSSPFGVYTSPSHGGWWYSTTDEDGATQAGERRHYKICQRG